MVDEATRYRIAVNVESKLEPSELEYLIDSNFRHPIMDVVEALPAGWNPLERKPDRAALDFIRGNLVKREDLRKLPFNVPGPDTSRNPAGVAAAGAASRRAPAPAARSVAARRRD